MIAVLFPQIGKAQIFESRTGVDTLTFAERISLRTNAVDWTLLTPNLGVEFDVKSTNWNRWAVGLTLKTKWNTPATFKNRVFYNITEVRADFRNYWRTRQINNKVPAHTGFIDRLFSCRRRVVKHPKTTYYRGAYMSFSDFSIKFGREGHQGKALSAGITYGIIKPLYAFRTGNTLDLDLGFDAGFVAVNSEKFIYNRADNCYTRTKQGSWKVVPFPMPTAARVGFVYRFGSYPITKKYRWRYDADAQYQYRIDSIANQRVVDAINKHNRDSVESVIYKEFWQVYDSAAVVNSAKADSMRIVNAKLKAEADRKQAEADRLKAVEAQKEKERLKAEKKNKGKKAEEKPEPTPEPEPVVYPESSYYTVKVPFANSGGYNATARVSYQDQEGLNKLWKAMMRRQGMKDGQIFYIGNRGGHNGGRSGINKTHYLFNGDMYFYLLDNMENQARLNI